MNALVAYYTARVDEALALLADPGATLTQAEIACRALEAHAARMGWSKSEIV